MYLFITIISGSHASLVFPLLPLVVESCIAVISVKNITHHRSRLETYFFFSTSIYFFYLHDWAGLNQLKNSFCGV